VTSPLLTRILIAGGYVIVGTLIVGAVIAIAVYRTERRRATREWLARDLEQIIFDYEVVEPSLWLAAPYDHLAELRARRLRRDRSVA
jgi:hypothetical protein